MSTSSPGQSVQIEMEKQHSGDRVKDLLKENRKLIDNENYLKRVNEFAIDLLKADTIDDALWIISTYLIEKFNFEDCVVYLLNDRSMCLEKVASHSVSDPSDRTVRNYLSIPMGEGIVGTVAITGQPEIINDTRKDPRYIVDEEVRLSELTVPIINNGKVIGIIDSENEKVNYYNDGHLETLIAISNLSAIKIDNLRAAERDKIHSQELERVNVELDKFVYNVTHDLKSPLASLQGKMFLLHEEKNPQLREKLFGNINSSIKLMAEFIDELLSYSRNANAALNNEKIVIRPFIQQIIAEHGYQNHAEKIDFRLEINPEMELMTDSTRFRVIMNNLISNVIKYQDFTKNQPTAIVRATENDLNVEVTVEDNGLGMSKSELDKIFEMFYRVPKHEKSTSGTGVGLYILNETITKLGGSVKAESTEGKGSVFTLTFPKDKVQQ